MEWDGRRQFENILTKPVVIIFGAVDARMKDEFGITKPAGGSASNTNLAIIFSLYAPESGFLNI